jgi:hypothetical protein
LSRPEQSDPGLARDRTALAWTRSALNMAGSGALIARAGFAANLDVLGVVAALTMAAVAALTWRHGWTLYRGRARADAPPGQQTGALGLLTTATLAIAIVAIVFSTAV